MKYRNALVILGIIFTTQMVLAAASEAQDKRPIAASDCVTVRALTGETALGSDNYTYSPVAIDPEHTHIAYTVRSPNLASNSINLQLYVKALDGKTPAKLLATGRLMSHIVWLNDSRHLLVLMKEMNGSNDRVIYQVDTQTGDRIPFITVDGDVTDYSTDHDADEIAYLVKRSVPTVPGTDRALSEKDLAAGYEIPYVPHTVQNNSGILLSRELYIAKRTNEKEWSTPTKVVILAPDGVSKREAYDDSMIISLSPNGKLLVVRDEWFFRDLPKLWQESPIVKSWSHTNSYGMSLLVQYDVDTGHSALSLKTALAASVPFWLSDSSSYVVIAYPTIDDDKGLIKRSLLWVQPTSGEVQTITDEVPVPSVDAPLLFWDGVKNELLYQTKPNTVSFFRHEKNQWKKIDQMEIPLPSSRPTIHATTDGEHFVTTYTDITTPAKLLLYERGWQQARLLEDINPEFAHLTLALADEFNWTTSTGYEATGYLLKPPDYIKGKRYPLVIQTTVSGSEFVCDVGEPSFPPQPLASSGIMYLIPTKTATYDYDKEVQSYPVGYPGHIGEGFYKTGLWDSAVDALDRGGLVDRNKVGIIGFSITGWPTLFSLVHGRTPYAAATVTDAALFSMGEYMQDLNTDMGTMNVDEAYLGGPPFGKTLKNWTDYSVSFNLDKIHTPLLLEFMGYGQQTPYIRTPQSKTFEIYGGLNHLGKPAEYYFYPRETHLMNNPQARLASLQRNVDWYRFWLQGYERPNPEDPDQYKRWEHLRELQNADDKARDGQASSNAAKPN